MSEEEEAGPFLATPGRLGGGVILGEGSTPAAEKAASWTSQGVGGAVHPSLGAQKWGVIKTTVTPLGA